jgi:hypothetical protein
MSRKEMFKASNGGGYRRSRSVEYFPTDFSRLHVQYFTPKVNFNAWNIPKPFQEKVFGLAPKVVETA